MRSRRAIRRNIRDKVFAALSQQAEQRAKTEGREFDAAAYREQFMKEVPLGMIELRQAFGPQGEYAKWVRERPTVAKINGVLFLHGGISPGDCAARLRRHQCRCVEGACRIAAA